jgi:hypothetical protein
MSHEALFEARLCKREIEETLNKMLQDFTDSTGLTVLSIDVTRIDVTHVGSCPLFQYQTDLEIKVEGSAHF